MSGTAGVSTLFANAVTATGAQLDANYGTIVAYVNDPTNRNNYAPGGAVTNTVALTFAPPVVGGYTAGLELTWKWGTTNTGGVVVNANGLGNAALVNPDGTALAAGQAVEGSIGKAVYDGTRFIFLAASTTPASAAQVSAAANLVAFVSPGRAQAHPGVAKAWCVFEGTLTGTNSVTIGYNMGSSIRLGAGTYAVGFATPFSSVNYAPIVTCGTGAAPASQVTGRGVGTVTFIVYNSTSGAPTDPTHVFMTVFGTQ